MNLAPKSPERVVKRGLDWFLQRSWFDRAWEFIAFLRSNARVWPGPPPLELSKSPYKCVIPLGLGSL